MVYSIAMNYLHQFPQRPVTRHVATLRKNAGPLMGCTLVLTYVVVACQTLVAAETDEGLAEGELSFAKFESERPLFLRLLSGKLFRVRDNHAETSSGGGQTWQQGGRVNPYQLGWKLNDVAIQLQAGSSRGRILVPLYLGMYGRHPDYTTEQRGGYAIWKGNKIRLETHTHIPEMSGSFVCYSDDEGQTWHSCVSETGRGFMVGYLNDGHMGHLTCEEPVIAELKDGRILCYMRSTCGRILKSYSEDGGEHWMKVQLTDIAMSNSPCALQRIPGTGDLVMVWNQMSAEEIRKGYRRGRLSVAISQDDGRTWKGVKTLELSPGLQPASWIEPPPVTAMVRGPSGPDDLMGELPDGFMLFGYPNIYFSKDKVFITYYATPPDGRGGSHRWRVFPVEWLYP